jgi:hypothetical protein
MVRNVSWSLGFSAFLVLLFLGSPSDAANRQAAKRAARALNHTQVINALQSAQTLLVAADHDYAGHRALAAKEVHKALAELGHKKGQTGVPPKTATAATAATKTTHAGRTADHEAQATSDAQLRQALQILQGVVPHINSTRHPQAATNVQAAIGQINTALAIK